MKSKIQLEIYEKDILKSIASQSKEETFDFVEKILNRFEYPTEAAGQLITHLEHYIDDYQKSIYQDELLNHMDSNGRYSSKYRKKKKIPQVDHKPTKPVIDKESEYKDAV